MAFTNHLGQLLVLTHLFLKLKKYPLLLVQISGGELYTTHISNISDLFYYKGLRTGSLVLDKRLQILICPSYSIIRKKPTKITIMKF